MDDLDQLDYEKELTELTEPIEKKTTRTRKMTPELLEKLKVARAKAHETIRQKGKIARQIKTEKTTIASNLAKEYIQKGYIKQPEEQQETKEPPKKHIELEQPKKTEPINIKPLLRGVKKVVKHKTIYYTSDYEDNSDIEKEDKIIKVKPKKTVRITQQHAEPKQQPTQEQKPQKHYNIIDDIINTYY